MAGNNWFRRLLAGSRGRIVAKLREGPATINELTETLSMSANAVRSQLSALERDGLVMAQPQSSAGVGKPPNTYQLTGDVGSLTPKAYAAVLDIILCAARDRVGAARYAQVLDDAATRIAGDRPIATSLEARLVETKNLLGTLGAEVEVQRSGRKVRLQGMDCPLTSVVAGHPELCRMLADVIGRRLGVTVTECCDRSTALPRCCFAAEIPGRA